MENIYGIELILDLQDCNTSKFTEENLRKYFTDLCKLINMKKHGEPLFWHDCSNTPHLKGISAMQFISTSNIVIHALDLLHTVFINIFSCKKFDTKLATDFSKNFFGAKKLHSKIIKRKTWH